MAKSAVRIFDFCLKIHPGFLAIVSALSIPAALYAGGEVVPLRKEFKQSSSYPYVFKPVPYLENGGPRGLRFGPDSTDCNRHNPPPLPEYARGKKEDNPPPPESTPTPPPVTITSGGPDVYSASSSLDQNPTVPVVPTPAYPAPAYPPPAFPGGMGLPEAPNLNNLPEEIRSIFNDPYIPRRRQLFFDPIFEPAVPLENPIQIGPPSRATYREQ